MAKGRNSEKIRKITFFAILTALVFTLQAISPMVKPFGLALALGIIPVIVGAAMYGPLCGMWLGLAFSGATFITDWASVAAFFDQRPVIAIFLVIFKIVAAGAISGVAYKLLAKENEIFAAMVASIIAPIVNTGIFLTFAGLLFRETIGVFGAFVAMILPNVIAEFLMCPLLAPALIRVAVAFRRLK